MPARSVPRLAVTLRGTRAVGRCVMFGFRAHDGPSLAATVAYYALLSVFPLLLMTTALGAALLDQTQLQAELSRILKTYLPPQAATAVERSVYEAVRSRGPVGAAAMALFLWSGSAATGALRHALNRVLEVQTPRPFWRRRLVDMLATLVLAGLLGASLSLAVARAIVLRLVPGLGAEVLRFLPGLEFFGRFGPGALAACTFLLAYRLLPARRLPWRVLVAGSLFATVLFETARALVFRAVEAFPRHQAVYGSLAGVIVFLLWVYVAALVILAGAELARCLTPECRGAPDGIRTRVAGLKDRSPRPG